jgi:hypothetical protein
VATGDDSDQHNGDWGTRATSSLATGDDSDQLKGDWGR